MRIRGAVLEEIGRDRPFAESRPIVISELDLDPPGPGELLVRIEVAGLCHSDLSVVDGNRVRPVPMLLGHEAAGIDQHFRVGDEKHVAQKRSPGWGWGRRRSWLGFATIGKQRRRAPLNHWGSKRRGNPILALRSNLPEVLRLKRRMIVLYRKQLDSRKTRAP